MSNLQELARLSKNLRVLYVEDEKEVRNFTSKLLNTFFDHIDTAVNGKEGLELFSKNSYDLVVTDLQMPVLSGIDMVTQIRKQNKNIQIIVMSAMKQTDNLIDSIKLGIDGYILKPLIPTQFTEVLEKSIKTIVLEQEASKAQNHLYYDDLTKLKSRHSLLESLAKIEQPFMPIIILVNIDSFRVYNELYGVSVGNEILKEFAKVLQQSVKQNNYDIYRTSGDEFALFEKATFTDIEKYERDLKGLFQTVKDNPLIIEGLKDPLNIEITVGVSFSNENPLAKANMALHSAKERGVDFIGYSHDLDREEELKDNLYWQKIINDAVDEKRVMAYYQPIVNKDQQIIKYEALMRIKYIDENNKQKIITPSNYLALSKKTKQYVKLTTFIIEEALQEMRECNVHISINLTYQDIKNNAIYRTLKENIKKYNLAQQTKFDISNNVIFELLESNSIQNYKLFKSFVAEFKEMGVKIAIDNFGAGFSDFSHIVSLAPNYVKIDGKLIKDININQQSYNLVKALVKFTKELNIKTIAEYVETKEIFDIVYSLGIDEFQGYFFGEPSKLTKVCS